MTESWTALKSCNYEDVNGPETEDVFRQLPDEILESIVWSLNMKETARLSCVSHRWESIWRCTPLLIFKNSHAIDKIKENRQVIPKERRGFVSWVDGVLEKHLGTTIAELRIIFDLDINWQSHVDKWVAIAIDKHVKRLELDFTSCWRCYNDVRICGKPLDVPPKLNTIKSSFLTSLCLKYVNVTDEFVDYLSRSCPLLEILCIEGSDRLTRVQLSAFEFKQVKHLEVSHCSNLKRIDISAPMLCSFILRSHPIMLHILYAPYLISVCVGDPTFRCRTAYLFQPLSEYLSQLTYLCLTLNLWYKKNLPIDNATDMPNLRHLEFQVIAYFHQSLREWCAPLIAAAPHLEKLTLKLRGRTIISDSFIRKWIGIPMKCLKTLELGGYVGQAPDLELAYFVFENATMLEEVIVDFVPFLDLELNPGDEEQRLVKLQTKLPKVVKLTIK